MKTKGKHRFLFISSLGLLGAAMLLWSGLAAAEGPWIGGATIGQAAIQDYELEAESDTRLDDTDAGWRVFLGYKFNESFGVGVSYLDLGTLEAAGTAFGGFTDEIEATALEAWVMGILPINEQFSLFGTLGVFSWDQEVIYSDSFEDFRGDVDGSGFAFGVGATYWLNEDFGVHATWHRYPDVGDRNITGHENDRDLYGIGVVFTFGE